MAGDPRNVTMHEGIEFNAVTYPIDSSTITFDGTLPRGAAATMLDKAVMIKTDGTIALVADGDEVRGKLLSVEHGGWAAVIEDGYTTLPLGNGNTAANGSKIVGALGAAGARGFVRAAIAGDAPKGRHFVSGQIDAANIEVEFE